MSTRILPPRLLRSSSSHHWLSSVIGATTSVARGVPGLSRGRFEVEPEAGAEPDDLVKVPPRRDCVWIGRFVLVDRSSDESDSPSLAVPLFSSSVGG